MLRMTFTEYRELCWILENISELALEEKYRPYIISARKNGISRNAERNLTADEKYALIEAINYYINLYSRLIAGYSNGNKSISSILHRLDIMRCIREKLLSSINT